MRNKLLLTALSMTAIMNIACAQDYNPYKSIGKKGKVLTAYGGRFNEFFDYDSIQRIGSVMFNIRTKKIVRLLNPDATFKKASDNSSSSRWYSIDRLADKYHSWSPYNYVENNPIRNIDPSGDSLVPTGSPTALGTFNNIINAGLGGFYTVGQTSTGKYILNAAGQSGIMNSKQQEFYNTLNNAITNATDVKFNIVDGNDAISKQVLMGNCACYAGSPVTQHTIDVGDANSLGTTGTVTAQGVANHEINEGTQIQTQGFTTGPQMIQAHNNAITSENKINAGIRIPNPLGDLTTSGNTSTLTLNMMTGVTMILGVPVAVPVIKTVIVKFNNGNVSGVSGN